MKLENFEYRGNKFFLINTTDLEGKEFIEKANNLFDIFFNQLIILDENLERQFAIDWQRVIDLEKDSETIQDMYDFLVMLNVLSEGIVNTHLIISKMMIHNPNYKLMYYFDTYADAKRYAELKFGKEYTKRHNLKIVRVNWEEVKKKEEDDEDAQKKR